jgi:hypothetical protein
VLTVALAAAGRGGEVEDALAAIKAVKREGDGNEKAAAAWKVVVKDGATSLPAVLAAFDGADATAANWLRSAVDAIAESEQMAGRKLPAEMLETFVKDAKRDARGRDIAFALLSQGDPAARTRLLPGFLDDPSPGLRREAIDHVSKTAAAAASNSGNPERAIYRKLFTAARDVDQVEALAKTLAQYGEKDVDVIGHLGLITRWQIAGPFDNSKLKGFAAPLPTVEKWTDFATGHPRALVDLYQALGKPQGLKDGKKDAVYAVCRTEIESPAERAVEVRLASQNAVRVYVNGAEVFSREEYHHAHKLDQHVARVTLKKGRNEILVKVCQDDAVMEWTLLWSFQCRVCDAIGGAVPFTVVTAPNAVPVKPAPKTPEPPKEKK